jgi:hypothetical protein
MLKCQIFISFPLLKLVIDFFYHFDINLHYETIREKFLLKKHNVYLS